MPYGFGYKRYYRRIGPNRVGGGLTVLGRSKYRSAYRRATVNTKRRSYGYRRVFSSYKRTPFGARYKTGQRFRR